jgi:hypothetical protein
MEMKKMLIVLSAMLVADLGIATDAFAAGAGGSGGTGGPSTVVASQIEAARKAAELPSWVITAPVRAHNFVADEGNRRNTTVISDQPAQAASGAGAHRPQSMGVTG